MSENCLRACSCRRQTAGRVAEGDEPRSGERSYRRKLQRRSAPPLGRWLLAAVAVWSWLGSGPLVARGEEPLRAFDQLMERFIAEQRAPGAALAIARDGRLVYAKGFGLADVEAERPVEPDSLFRIASISKPITAAAVLLLARDSQLSLDDRVVDVLELRSPKDERFAEVTIRQLLRHTGGWDRGIAGDPMFKSVEIARQLDVPAPAPAAAVIRHMLDEPLQHDPGTRYAYSNFGYCLLGRVVEKVSRQPYEQFVRQQVLTPLGAERMRLGRTRLADRAPREVRYYDEDRGRGPSVFPPLGEEVDLPYGAWHLEAMDSHGGWIGSAMDVCRFGAGLPQLLTRSELKESFARADLVESFDADDERTHYGFGWMVRRVDQGINTWHTGSLPGTGTLLVRRHDGLCWAVLFNTRNGSGERLTAQIDPLLHQVADSIQQWPTAAEAGDDARQGE